MGRGLKTKQGQSSYLVGAHLEDLITHIPMTTFRLDGWSIDIVVHEWFWHKSNEFLICPNFWNFIIIICVEIFIIIMKLKICKFSRVGFELQVLKFKILKRRQFRHTRLSHKHNKNVFIIFYNYYLTKVSKLKNQLSKLSFKI